MTLYINEILGKLLQTQGFEQVLEKESSKPHRAALPPQFPLSGHRRQQENRTSIEAISRRSMMSEVSHKAMASEANAASAPPSSISSGISRAFSFRKKPDYANTSVNLRPLKLVEEQHPAPRIESLSHGRARTHDENAQRDLAEDKLSKRASWVPGWFGKGAGNMENNN